jgi:hypothetical protein
MFRRYPKVYEGELKFLCQPKGLILEKIHILMFMGSEITKHKICLNYEAFFLNKNPFEHSALKLAK